MSQQPISKLPRTLTQLVNNVLDYERPEDHRDQITLHKLVNAVENDDLIEVMPDDEENGVEQEGVAEHVAEDVQDYMNNSHGDNGGVAVVERPRTGKKSGKANKPDKTKPVTAKRPVTKDAKVAKTSPIAKEPKEKVGKDKFGCREGSKLARVNAVLTKKAKTMREIATEAGLEGETYYDHLGRLIEKGAVEKLEDGTYRLAQSKK
jgi:hypothetical protein